MSQHNSSQITLPIEDQELNPGQETPAQGNATAGTGAFMVDSYADRLMDDLFEDVEHMLSGGMPRLSPEPTPEPMPAAPPQPAFSPLLFYPQADASASIVDTDDDLALLTEMGEPSFASQKKPRAFDRLLLVAGCMSVVVTLGVWLASQGVLSRLFAAAPVAQNQPAAGNPTAVVNPETQAAADARFADYLRRALTVIDQRATGGPVASLPLAPTGSASSPVNLPPVPVPGRLVPLPSSGTPTAPGSNQDLNQVLNRLASVLEKLYPLMNRSGQVATNSPAMPPVANAPTQSLTPVAPARTLIGVVEWGNRSAILVELNGVTERYEIGETIGASGWNLVEVSKQRAVFRKNGEVRSVFVGQKF